MRDRQRPGSSSLAFPVVRAAGASRSKNQQGLRGSTRWPCRQNASGVLPAPLHRNGLQITTRPRNAGNSPRGNQCGNANLRVGLSRQPRPSQQITDSGPGGAAQAGGSLAATAAARTTRPRRTSARCRRSSRSRSSAPCAGSTSRTRKARSRRVDGRAPSAGAAREGGSRPRQSALEVHIRSGCACRRMDTTSACGKSGFPHGFELGGRRTMVLVILHSPLLSATGRPRSARKLAR